MATQVYRCLVHGEVDYLVDRGVDVPPSIPCLEDNGKGGICGKASSWVPQVIPTIWKCPK